MEKSNGKEKYDVGHGKPPIKRRFTKGRSGNPAGRPQVAQNFGHYLFKALNKSVVVTLGNQKIKMTMMEIIVRRLAADATRGKIRYARLLIKLMKQFDSESMKQQLKIVVIDDPKKDQD